ncbi:MAG: hypothetical protein EZS28_032229 [Streblomastix strix]|uniref:Uncharacterized protein n=1 Tax=Streblomastix strix TaxID=222440 RepID=A0A5J4UR31_9EUKA|nr:MAG: hypothetical protein EZS28_032229 [Streblomastix strix]
MAVPSEYNVIDGLIGLGEYVHLKLLNKMEDFPDVQYFIASELENPYSTRQGVRLERANGLLRNIVALQDVHLYCQSFLYWNGFDGYISYRRNCTKDNSGFSFDLLLTMELNMNDGTLHFFVDDIHQPVFVKGINEPAKFFV